MKVRITRSDLKEGASTAVRAISAKSPLPILGHILLRAEGDALELTATDLELVIRCTLPAQVVEPGALTVPARLLAGVVAGLEEDEVVLEAVGSRLRITTTSSDFKLSTQLAEEYPIIPQPEGAMAIVLPQVQLRSMISGVSFAAAMPDEARAMLTGVQVRLEAGVATLTATDGRRMARMTRPLEGDSSSISYTTVVPARAMNELQRVLAATHGPVELTPVQGQLFFRFGAFLLVTRILDEGRFPDCDAIIPKAASRLVYVKRQRLLGAVRRATFLAQEKDSPSLIRISIQATELSIRSNTPDVGEDHEVVPVNLQGEDITIAFNGRYLEEVLAHISSDEVVIKLNDPLSMAVVQPVGDVDGEGSTYLVMPIRLKEAFE